MQVIDIQGVFPAESLSKLCRAQCACALCGGKPRLHTKLSTAAVDCCRSHLQTSVAWIAHCRRCAMHADPAWRRDGPIIARPRKPSRNPAARALSRRFIADGDPLFSIIQAAGWPIWPLDHLLHRGPGTGHRTPRQPAQRAGRARQVARRGDLAHAHQPAFVGRGQQAGRQLGTGSGAGRGRAQRGGRATHQRTGTAPGVRERRPRVGAPPRALPQHAWAPSPRPRRCSACSARWSA